MEKSKELLNILFPLPVKIKRKELAKENKENFNKYWKEKEARLSINGDTTQRGITKRIEGNRGGYFFIGKVGNYQIPMKRVRINENSIEGILISVNGVTPYFDEKGIKIHGIIKLGEI